jgi:hypothetical protein
MYHTTLNDELAPPLHPETVKIKEGSVIDFDTARAAKEARSWQNLQEAVDELGTVLHRCCVENRLLMPPNGIGFPLAPGIVVTGVGHTAVTRAQHAESLLTDDAAQQLGRPVLLRVNPTL